MDANADRGFNLVCPTPGGAVDIVQLAHGGGGRLSQKLLESVFLPSFGCAELNRRHDGAVLTAGAGRLAFTTDSFVVRPLFFPGGSIGELAVYGTVNDLAMCGARPLYLSAAFILEEGLEIDLLRRVVDAMARAAEHAGVEIVTGDTKVVDKGKGDQVFITTAGIGLLQADGPPIGPHRLEEGDAVLLSGDLGRHGIAILSVREGLEFGGELASDAAPLWQPVSRLLDEGIELHCLRDLTRGGLSSALNEIAAAAKVGIELDESSVSVCDQVRGACELLGLDPFYVANEGRFVAFVPADQAGTALRILHDCDVAKGATIAGHVTAAHPTTVVLRTTIGGSRVVDMLSGEQLPRIC